MAIIFNTDINTDQLLYAFNNNIVEFKSNTTGVTQVKAEILTNGNTYTIYPNPLGVFWFNFQGIKEVELNTNNYADTVAPDLAVSYVYNWTPETILSETITFKVYLSNATIETATRAVTWLNGYANLIEFKRKYPNLILDYNAFLLKPLPLVKYWAGLPFDISFYADPADDFTLKNNNSGIDYTFTNTDVVPRLFFSDGRLDISIDDYVPLADGFNDCSITSGSNDINFYVEKITSYCDGVYLKWMNSFGGWNYWQFYKGNENLNTKELGFLNNDFNNLENTVSPYISLGNESSNQISIVQENITPDEMELLRDLLDNVKVYMFTGIPFTQSSATDWVEINLKGGQYRLTNAREKLNSLSLTLELPKNVNRKL